jgi:predicted transcriptional regulator
VWIAEGETAGATAWTATNVAVAQVCFLEWILQVGGRATTTGSIDVVMRLGELERAVMDVLWDRRTPLTVREVAESLHDRELAYTTVMTVLDRLAGKGMVERERAGRAWSYRPAASREAYIAQLMLDALDLAGSRDAALVRFARSVSGTEADVLRAALAEEAADGKS